MKKYRMPIALLCLMAMLAGVFYYLYTAPAQPAAPPLRVSLILYERGSDPWTALHMGARQACNDLGLELTPTTPVDGNDPARQRAAVERELASGAAGILLAANNSDELRDWAIEEAGRTPLVLLQSGIGGALPVVSADNTAMGRTLAEEVAQREQRVLVLAINLQRDSVRLRYEAFSEAAQAAGVQVDLFSGDIGGLEHQLGLYSTGSIPALVAFDTETLDRAIDAVLPLEEAPLLYGFGGNDKTVYHLDRGLVQKMCCDDEFNMGYLAVVQLAEKMGLPTPDLPETVDYALVDRDNLYNEEVARLLFPIIQ